ncbi:MAG: hypothetical protein OJF49_003798 [Ktedonobacterales bacterium]|nr:MAG: hypothetical protein OJF49_003798 [Ktedonobacterales bacterium]
MVYCGTSHAFLQLGRTEGASVAERLAHILYLNWAVRAQ